LTDILIVNRRQVNAEKIANDFSSKFRVRVIPTLRDLGARPDIIIGTIPANKTREEDFKILFEGASESGLCVDMAYKPRKMPLLALAEGQPGWETVPGVEVLLHQAFDQFELWTGLKAPLEEMTGMIAASASQEAEARQENFDGRLNLRTSQPP
jgi:shikimate 5-dehydrogenase